MATSIKQYNPIKGRVLRVVILNDCGVPVTGTGGGQIVLSGFTQVGSSAQYETGDEYIVKTADAALCVNEKDPDILKRFELTIDMCVVNPGLIANTVSPARLLTFSEPPTGTGFALAEGEATTHFSLEVWQRVAGAASCDTGGNPLWVYNAWPHLTNGKIGDYNIANEPSSIQITAESKAVSPAWTVGIPWLGAGAVSPIPDHWFQNLTSVTPPDPSPNIVDL